MGAGKYWIRILWVYWKADQISSSREALLGLILLFLFNRVGEICEQICDEREQTLNQILAEMDGFAPHESVVVFAATNRPDVLDPALVRPGRFDRRIILNLPRQAREKILNIHTRDKPLAQDVDLRNMAERTAGLSGADLRNLVNEAALLAARQDKQQLARENFEQARDKILLGIERDMVIPGQSPRSQRPLITI